MSRDELIAIIRTAVREEIMAHGGQRAEGYLTLTEAAGRIGIDRSTMWRWVSDGVVPRNAVTRVGTHHRIAAWWVQGRKS